MDGLLLTVGFLLQAYCVNWIIFYIRDRRVRHKKKCTSIYMHNEYLVQDYRGMVMTQEEHRRQWGFPGYPTTHDTNCDCTHCTTATHHYGCIRQNPQTRRQVFDSLNNRDYFIPLIEAKKNFLPKKDIKSHTLVERKYTIRRPGVYTVDTRLNIGEVDVSYYNDFRNRENE